MSVSDVVACRICVHVWVQNLPNMCDTRRWMSEDVPACLRTHALHICHCVCVCVCTHSRWMAMWCARQYRDTGRRHVYVLCPVSKIFFAFGYCVWANASVLEFVFLLRSSDLLLVGRYMVLVNGLVLVNDLVEVLICGNFYFEIFCRMCVPLWVELSFFCPWWQRQMQK